MKSLATISLSLAALSAVAAPDAWAGGPSLPSTSPALKISRMTVSPRLVTPLVTIKTESPAGDLGFRCGSGWAQGYTTSAPALSWEVTDDVDLAVRLEDAWNGVSAVLVFPDGSTVCEDDREFLAQRWPKGRYHLFLTSSATTAAAKVMFTSESAALAAAPVLALKAATSAPVQVTTPAVVYKGGYNHVFHDSNHQLDCTSSEVSEMPSAYVEVAAPTATMRISVWGDNHNGAVIRAAGKTWIYCGNLMSAPQGGWPAGRIEIYPLGKLSQKGDTFVVAVDDPAVPARDAAVHEIAIDHKLAKPLFLTIPMRQARAVLPEGLFGGGCRGAAFSGVPDVVVTSARPIAGLTIRPLATANPVTTLVRYPKQAACVNQDHSGGGATRGKGQEHAADERGAFDAPSWQTSHDVAQLVTDGAFDLHLGSWPGKDVATVTLMIFDDSTELSPLDLAKLPPEAYGDRWIARAYPQLNVARVTPHSRASLELAATVFGTAPRELFVTPKLELDGDLAAATGLGPKATLPAKGEPLLILGIASEQATVLAADGLVFRVPTKYLVALPEGAAALPAKPRPIEPSTKIETVAGLLPASDKSFAAYNKQREARDKCRERAFAPYGRQLPSISRPGGVDVVIIKNAAYNRIEDAGNAAMDKQCGTDEAFAKKTEGMRVKMLAAFEASRPALLSTATASFK
jgi:hypothetical protein